MMETSDRDEGRTPPAWRSRAFVQPLLVTLGGVVTTIAVFAAVGSMRNLLDPCDGCTPGYGIVGAIIEALLILALGVLLTGFVVGWSSPDARLAIGAIVVASATLSLVVSALVVGSDRAAGLLDADQIRDDVVSVPLIAVGILIPIAVGFLIGRVVRSARTPRPES